MLHRLFGQLRACLHAPPHLLARSTYEIVALITHAYTLEPERVALEWRAYLAAQRHLPELTACSLAELHALHAVYPGGQIALELHDEEETAALWQVPEVATLQRIDLSGSIVDDISAHALTRSPYLGALRTLSLQQTGLDTQAVDHLCGARNLAALERLDISHNDFGGKALELLAASRAFDSLTHLDISNKRKIDAERSHVILSTRFAPQLVELGINRCGLRGLTNELTHHGSLQALDISSNYMNDIDLSQFIAHPNSRGLRHLDLGQNSIGDQGLLMVLDHCARVHTLHMAKTRLTELATEHLVHSTHDLNSIDLSRTRQHTAGALTLAEGRFEGLHTLYMDECRLEFAGIQTLLSSQAFPRLHWCSLARNVKVRPHSIASRLGLLTERSPRSVLWHERERRQRDLHARPPTLDISSNALTPAQASALFDALHTHHFVHLNLSDNPLGKQGFEALARSSCAARITHLTAHATQMDEGALLALIQGMPGLRALMLGANRHLGDEGARELAAWEGMSRLETLDLRACDLTSRGVEALLESPHISAKLTLCVGLDDALDATSARALEELARDRDVALHVSMPES